MQQTDIVKAIEAHIAKTGLKASSIGQFAVGNRHAYERIKKGTAHRSTEDAVMDWIKTDREARNASSDGQS